eukprot:1755088-Pleurochrysis_carterae.AAC.1
MSHAHSSSGAEIRAPWKRRSICAPLPSDAAACTLSAICAAHCAHAFKLLRIVGEDDGVPLVFLALTERSCPASLVLPLQMAGWGALAPAGAAAIVAHNIALGGERDDGVVYVALVVHALGNLSGASSWRCSKSGGPWPQSRLLSICTLLATYIGVGSADRAHGRFNALSPGITTLGK